MGYNFENPVYLLDINIDNILVDDGSLVDCLYGFIIFYDQKTTRHIFNIKKAAVKFLFLQYEILSSALFQSQK